MVDQDKLETNNMQTRRNIRARLDSAAQAAGWEEARPNAVHLTSGPGKR